MLPPHQSCGRAGTTALPRRLAGPPQTRENDLATTVAPAYTRTCLFMQLYHTGTVQVGPNTASAVLHVACKCTTHKNPHAARLQSNAALMLHDMWFQAIVARLCSPSTTCAASGRLLCAHCSDGSEYDMDLMTRFSLKHALTFCSALEPVHGAMRSPGGSAANL